MRKRIGECLLLAGLISEPDLGAALAEQERTGERLGAVLLRLRLADEWQLARVLACQLGLPYANLARNPPDPDAFALIPKEVAAKRLSVGVHLEHDHLTVAMADPLGFGAINDLETRTGRRISPVIATPTSIVRAIQTGYAPGIRAGFRSGDRRAPSCATCRGMLESGWQFCPHCAARRPARPSPLPDAASM